MTYQSVEEVAHKIRIINRELKWLKDSFKPTDKNPCGGWGTVEDRMRNLRHDRRVLQDLKKRIKEEWERDRAERLALRQIFKKYNNDIYPSDIGQDWSWRREGGIIVCIIEGKVFMEVVQYPQNKS